MRIHAHINEEPQKCKLKSLPALKSMRRARMMEREKKNNSQKLNLYFDD